MSTQGINLMEFGSALGREEMKKIMAGSGCHKCCWNDWDNICSTCKIGTQCESGAHTHICSESSCNYT